MKKTTKSKKFTFKPPAIAPDRIFNETPETISKTVRRYRKLADITQKELAERCNLKRASIGALEEGRLMNVSDKKIWAVCKALNIDPSALSKEIVLRSASARKLDELIQSGSIAPDASSALLKLFEKALNPDAAPPEASRVQALLSQAVSADEDVLGRFGDWTLATAPMGRLIILDRTEKSVEITTETMKTIHELDIPITLYNRLKELESQGYIKGGFSRSAAGGGRRKAKAGARAEFEKLCRRVGNLVENPHALRMSYYNDFKAAARKTGASEEQGIPTMFETPIIEMSPDDYALVNVTGDSMEPLICDGDKVLIERTDEPPGDGAIVLVNYEGGMIKRLFRSGNLVILRSENKKYSDIEISASEAEEKGFRVAGRVKNVWREL